MLGAGCKTRLGSKVERFNPHIILCLGVSGEYSTAMFCTFVDGTHAIPRCKMSQKIRADLARKPGVGPMPSLTKQRFVLAHVRVRVHRAPCVLGVEQLYTQCACAYVHACGVCARACMCYITTWRVCCMFNLLAACAMPCLGVPSGDDLHAARSCVAYLLTIQHNGYQYTHDDALPCYLIVASIHTMMRCHAVSSLPVLVLLFRGYCITTVAPAAHPAPRTIAVLGWCRAVDQNTGATPPSSATL